jgi:DNA-binding transcriptional MerR regulator
MTAVARPHGPRGKGGEEFPYRMKDLCDRTGLSRQVVHFYIEQGLLPEGHKTGRNMAYYSEAHVERLRVIRQLQQEQFLPLRAIRAVLDEEEGGFTTQQRHLLLDVKHRLGSLAAPAAEPELVPLHPLLLRSGVSREDAEAIARAGVVTITKKKGRAHIAKDDAWMIELWSELRGAGFTRALVFVPEDVSGFAEEIESIFAKETAMLKQRMSHLPPEEVARLVEAAVPLLNQFMARYHESLVRKFFASIQP